MAKKPFKIEVRTIAEMEATPDVVCSACGQPILDFRAGNRHWGSRLPGADRKAVYYSHKACCEAVDARFQTPCCAGLDENEPGPRRCPRGVRPPRF